MAHGFAAIDAKVERGMRFVTTPRAIPSVFAIDIDHILVVLAPTMRLAFWFGFFVIQKSRVMEHELHTHADDKDSCSDHAALEVGRLFANIRANDGRDAVQDASNDNNFE